MNNIVTLKEFRQDVARYARHVAKGKSLIVTKRSRPLFRVAPVEEEGWETLINLTKFRKNVMPASELLKILKSL